MEKINNVNSSGKALRELGIIGRLSSKKHIWQRKTTIFKIKMNLMNVESR
jgi:hypothetical protein